jgi:hypothetical protein
MANCWRLVWLSVTAAGILHCSSGLDGGWGGAGAGAPAAGGAPLGDGGAALGGVRSEAGSQQRGGAAQAETGGEGADAGLGGAAQSAAGAAGAAGAAAGAAGAAASCGARRCDSSADNDCNGRSDEEEPECTRCEVGAPPAACVAADVLGECQKGESTCSLSEDESSVVAGCSPGIATSEACGPTAPDANCNGVVGDGDYYVDSTSSTCAAEVTIGSKRAVLFKATQGGAVQVVSCRGGCGSAFVAIAPCPANSALVTSLGFAASAAQPGYEAVTTDAFSCSFTPYAQAQITVRAPSVTFYTLPLSP